MKRFRDHIDQYNPLGYGSADVFLSRGISRPQRKSKARKAINQARNRVAQKKAKRRK